MIMEKNKDDKKECSDFMFSLGKVAGYLSREEDRLSILKDIDQKNIDTLRERLIDFSCEIRRGN